MNKSTFKQIKKAVSRVILVAFFSTSVQLQTYASTFATEGTGNIAQVDPIPFMPKPGVMVHLSPEYTPAYLKGMVIHPENALKFDFIVYKGDQVLTDAEKRIEYTKLTKYFLASLAIPDDDQWVNLSPYEKDRIIKDDFGKTEMGRDLLSQDYMLKQITASLIYPEDNLGKKFWDKVYAQAQEQYGTSDIPVNTFNKVWILPDDALIYEKGNTAYVLKNHLRVMLEEDYLSLQKHSGIQSVAIDNKTHGIASKIVRQIVLPELEREVNEGENFAALRQIYSGMLLAAWYKRALKESLLSRIYANKAKVKGIDQDPKSNEEIYQQYLKAYKKGVFNFIKEDVNKYTNETIPRKYFSGGAGSYNEAQLVFHADPVHFISSVDPAQIAGGQRELGNENLFEVNLEGVNPAMTALDVRGPERASINELLHKLTLQNLSLDNIKERNAAVEMMRNFQSVLMAKAREYNTSLIVRRGKPFDRGIFLEKSKEIFGNQALPDGAFDLFAAIIYNEDGRLRFASTIDSLTNLIEKDQLFPEQLGINRVVKGMTDQDANVSIFAPVPVENAGDPFEGIEQVRKNVQNQLKGKVDEYLKWINWNPDHRNLIVEAITSLLEVKAQVIEKGGKKSYDIKVESEFAASTDNAMTLKSVLWGAIILLSAPLIEAPVHALNERIASMNAPPKINASLTALLADADAKIKDLQNIDNENIENKIDFDVQMGKFRLKEKELLPVLYKLQHAYLNDSVVRPTPEQFTQEIRSVWIGEALKKMFDRYSHATTDEQKKLFTKNINDIDAEIQSLQMTGNDQAGGKSLAEANHAMTSIGKEYGGIDFNSANLHLQIKRDGHGVPLPISQQDLSQINIDGLVPVIIDIRPAASLPIFSQIQNTAA